jgi:hypothetical protein
MSAPEFDIVFRGDIVIGHALADVKLKLQQLFKTDAAKVDALFTGRPVPLKRNLDEATAQKYRDVLLKAGALVEVVPAGKFSATPAPAARPSAPAPKPAVAAAASATPAKPVVWTLAPVGTRLVDAAYRPVVTVPTINTSHLSIRPQSGNLVDASEKKAEPVAAVVAPALGIAELGADLITADEKMELPVIEIELENWEIAPAGSDLVSAHERPSVAPVPVTVGNFGLAPVGSDLGQIKSQVKAVTPDISKLRLADSAK